MLISHEICKQLFPVHDWINDYPYTLLHLCDENSSYFDKEYKEFYREKLKVSKFSIGDNGGYEVGSAIPNEILYRLGEELQPTHIVLPDIAFSREETQRRVLEYIEKYKDKSTPKFIACIQGQGMRDLVEMYRLYHSIKEIDIVAISMCIVPREDKDRFARVKMIESLIKIIGSTKPLHLLGCKHPGEFKRYSDYAKSRIHSLDTSAPIVYGWNRIEFNDIKDLLDLDVPKPQEKLAENLDIKLDSEQLSIIADNIRRFRSFSA